MTVSHKQFLNVNDSPPALLRWRFYFLLRSQDFGREAELSREGMSTVCVVREDDRYSLENRFPVPLLSQKRAGGRGCLLQDRVQLLYPSLAHTGFNRTGASRKDNIHAKRKLKRARMHFHFGF